MTPSTRYHSSPSSSCGRAWPLSPSCWAGILLTHPHRPVLLWCRMGASYRASGCTPASCWGTSLSGLYPSVIRYPTRRDSPLVWTVPVCHPFHPGRWVYQWWYRVGARDGRAAAAPSCEITWRPRRSAGIMLLASLSRQKRKETEGRSPYWIL